MGTNITVHCPQCGSIDIRERNTAYAEVEVTKWDQDPDGTPHPTDYDLPFSADWECADTGDPYVCRVCRWSGFADELIVRSPASVPIPEAPSDGN